MISYQADFNLEISCKNSQESFAHHKELFLPILCESGAYGVYRTDVSIVSYI